MESSVNDIEVEKLRVELTHTTLFALLIVACAVISAMLILIGFTPLGMVFFGLSSGGNIFANNVVRFSAVIATIGYGFFAQYQFRRGKINVLLLVAMTITWIFTVFIALKGFKM